MRNFGLLLAFSSLLCSTAFAENGVSTTELVLGTANVQGGPAADLGLQLNAGAKAFIERVNKNGGVEGRKIKWLLEDDGYEPANTIEKTKKLIENDRVFCLFNYVGTPTSLSVLPILASNDVPLVGAFTGAETLRSPVVKNVFNVRGSYWDEAEVMIQNLVDKKGLKKIAIFMQDDGFGTAVQGGVARALDKRGLKPVALGKFPRNTEKVEEGLAAIQKSGADAVVMVGTYKPLAVFVKKARTSGFKPIFLTVSFVGTESFVKEVGPDGDGTYITQVVPNPESSQAEIVKQYQADMLAIGAKTSYASLEGYLNANVLVEALKAAGKNPTRDSLRQALESMNKDLGGMKISYSKTKHQASSTIFLTKVSGGKVTEVSKID